MNSRTMWAKGLVIVGTLASAVGTLDPMEGSILILAGGGLIALGTWLGEYSRPMRLYWLWVFGLLLAGVGTVWGFSAVGGLGGNTGRSMWWALTMLPYPIGWLMGFGGMILRMVRSVTARGRKDGNGPGIAA